MLSPPAPAEVPAHAQRSQRRDHQQHHPDRLDQLGRQVQHRGRHQQAGAGTDQLVEEGVGTVFHPLAPRWRRISSEGAAGGLRRPSFVPWRR